MMKLDEMKGNGMREGGVVVTVVMVAVDHHYYLLDSSVI